MRLAKAKAVILETILTEKVVDEDAIYAAIPRAPYDQNDPAAEYDHYDLVTDALHELLDEAEVEAIDSGGMFHSIAYVPKSYVMALSQTGLIVMGDEPDEDGNPWYYWTKSSGYSGR